MSGNDPALYGMGAGRIAQSVSTGRALFCLVISHTETAHTPGITAAGASPDLIGYTAPADAELIHYGCCKSIDGAPMTPDGKPTPALLTRAALKGAQIGHVVLDAGCIIKPQMPHIRTGLPCGRNIASKPAMVYDDFDRALECGRDIGEALSHITDCLIIGESVPGGTTTALAVMRGLGLGDRVSSSMPENPVSLKDTIVRKALARCHTADPLEIAAQLCDPMMPIVAGMVNAASRNSNVILAGGTQMAAVLSICAHTGFDVRHTAIGTTSYIVDDAEARLLDTIYSIAKIPVIAADPGLADSAVPGLRAYADGFAKEGAGAGGCLAISMIRTGRGSSWARRIIEDEYLKIFT